MAGKQELKIRVGDVGEVEATLAGRGAVYDREKDAVDTYFVQPKGKVLKISESVDGDKIVGLEARDGGFVFTRRETIDDAEEQKKRLREMYGVLGVLRKKRRLYTYGAYAISLEMIEEVGNFLVFLGDTVEKELVEQEFGFADPKYIEVPFVKVLLDSKK